MELGELLASYKRDLLDTEILPHYLDLFPATISHRHHLYPAFAAVDVGGGDCPYRI